MILYIYIYIYIYIYSISLQTAAVSLFESSSVQLRSKEDLEGPERSNYCQSCEHFISLVATLLDQQRAQLKKAKECNIALCIYIHIYITYIIIIYIIYVYYIYICIYIIYAYKCISVKRFSIDNILKVCHNNLYLTLTRNASIFLKFLQYPLKAWSQLVQFSSSFF